MTVPKTLVDQKLLSTGEVAKTLGVHRGTVWKWIDSGLLKAEKVTDRYRGVSKKAVSDFKRMYRNAAPTPPTGEPASVPAVSPKKARASEKAPRRKTK